MLRKVIAIDSEKCNGCGLCAQACHEGAIALVDGKARLMREDFCDGLGDCLPACPVGAITFERREAPAYDAAAVAAARRGEAPQGTRPGQTPQAAAEPADAGESLPCGCPGTQSRSLHRPAAVPAARGDAPSQLRQWPVQIRLAPVNAPYFDQAKLLIAADCTAYAHGDFHNRFMAGRITLVGCPKLDPVDYAEKLTRILAENEVQSVTVVRMEVPCCGGLERAVKQALQDSGKFIPWQVVTIATDGAVVD